MSIPATPGDFPGEVKPLRPCRWARWDPPFPSDSSDWAPSTRHCCAKVPADATPDRLQIAVAQILLHHVQDSLPQWAAITGDEILTNRKRHLRHKDALLRFQPQLLFSINWATSGPGYEWPEVYHVTYLPGFEKLIFTASRDGDDAWGCEDHAVGVGSDDGLEEAAKKVLTAYWQEQADGRDQQRWESCIEEGLIDFRTANAWADEVWPEGDRSTGPRPSAGATMPVSGKPRGNPFDGFGAAN
jgi:hypothetical protein